MRESQSDENCCVFCDKPADKELEIKDVSGAVYRVCSSKCEEVVREMLNGYGSSPIVDQSKTYPVMFAA